MEEKHRKKILDNLDKLTDGIQINDLLNQLLKKRMFNSYMVDEIMKTEDQKKLSFLYRYVTTRGPKAFDDLCDALKEIDRSDLATLLTSKGPNPLKIFLNGCASNQPSLKEQYPDNEEWIVTQGSEPFDFDCERVYRMRSSPRGLALVINIRKYVNDTMDEREGSDKDVERLKQVLPQLGYEVIVEEDLTADEMEKKVYDFSRNKRHSLCDSAIVIVMAHGKDRMDGSNTVMIAGWDTQLVSWHVLINMLSARECEPLRGKPKMFFFQTCRGDSFNHPVTANICNGVTEENEVREVEAIIVNGVEEENQKNEVYASLENGIIEKNHKNKVDGSLGNEVEEETQKKVDVRLEKEVEEEFQNNEAEVRLENGYGDDVVEGERNGIVQTDGVFMGRTHVIRSDSDIFIGHATSPGNVSMRDPDTGSWYIQTLCRVLARDAWSQDLYSMLQTVRQECKKLGLEDEWFMEEFHQGFNKKLFFQPGIDSALHPLIMSNQS